MPKYRGLLQPEASVKGARAPWGAQDENGLDADRAVVVEAVDLESAASKLWLEGKGLGMSLVSVELQAGPLAFDDEELSRALVSVEPYTDAPFMERELFEGQASPLYESYDFASTVADVAQALSQSGLLPGLSVSLVAGSDGVVDYSMVEMHVVGGEYRSTGCELKHLTDDRSAVGWDGVLAIARALISTASAVA